MPNVMILTSLIAALVSIIVGLGSAVLGHFLLERRSRKAELMKLRIDAYTDFVKVSSHLAVARRNGRVIDEEKELAVLNDAKVRMLIFAPVDVVQELEKFWKHGGTLEGEAEILAFTSLCRTLRSSLKQEPLPHKLYRYNDDDEGVELSDVLFKVEPSPYSYRASQGSNTP